MLIADCCKGRTADCIDGFKKKENNRRRNRLLWLNGRADLQKLKFHQWSRRQTQKDEQESVKIRRARTGGISLQDRAAIIGSRYAADGLLIRPSTELFVVQNTDGERQWMKRGW